jgi:hypothetical protein
LIDFWLSPPQLPRALFPSEDVRETAMADVWMRQVERLAHYRELSAQFREWAETETNPEARAGLLDMARQYDRLVSDLFNGALTIEVQRITRFPLPRLIGV